VTELPLSRIALKGFLDLVSGANDGGILAFLWDFDFPPLVPQPGRQIGPFISRAQKASCVVDSHFNGKLRHDDNRAMGPLVRMASGTDLSERQIATYSR
jgi:hypothetical protein